MFEGLNHIVLSGESYPIKCDLVVLEKIQEEFGSLDEFENRLIPWQPKLDENGKEVQNAEGKTIFMGRIPDIKTVNRAILYMMNEGEEIAAECENRTPNAWTLKQIARKVDISPVTLADRLHDEYMRCLKVKNGETTQNQTETKTEKENG